MVSVLAGLVLLPLLDTGVPALVVLAVVLGRVALTPMHGPAAAMAGESFPIEVRYSGASLGFQIGSIAGGALAPIVATLLLTSPAGIWGVSGYLGALLVLSGVGAVGLGRLGARSAAAPPPPATVR